MNLREQIARAMFSQHFVGMRNKWEESPIQDYWLALADAALVSIQPILDEVRGALENFLIFMEAAMSDGDKKYIIGESDIELKPDGEYMLSDARVVLKKLLHLQPKDQEVN